MLTDSNIFFSFIFCYLNPRCVSVLCGVYRSESAESGRAGQAQGHDPQPLDQRQAAPGRRHLKHHRRGRPQPATGHTLQEPNIIVDFNDSNAIHDDDKVDFWLFGGCDKFIVFCCYIFCKDIRKYPINIISTWRCQNSQSDAQSSNIAFSNIDNNVVIRTTTTTTNRFFQHQHQHWCIIILD